MGIAWPSFNTHRQIISYTFQKLPEVAVIPGPKFVFAHIIAPHPPFVFDKSGNPITPDYTYSLNAPTDRNIFEFRDGYLDQLTILTMRYSLQLMASLQILITHR